MEIHEKIRLLRIEKRMSQEELALRVGYKSRASINKIELGYQEVPRRKLRALANALEVPPDYLADGWVVLAPREQEVLSRFRALSPVNQDFALSFLDKLLLFNQDAT